MHFARLANTLLIDEESARDNHVLACNFATKCACVPVRTLSRRPGDEAVHGSRERLAADRLPGAVVVDRVVMPGPLGA